MLSSETFKMRAGWDSYSTDTKLVVIGVLLGGLFLLTLLLLIVALSCGWRWCCSQKKAVAAANAAVAGTQRPDPAATSTSV
jgi:hypothetical protein